MFAGNLYSVKTLIYLQCERHLKGSAAEYRDLLIMCDN